MSTQAFTFENISATTDAFAVLGGEYILVTHATFGGGSVKVQLLAADETTWVDGPGASSQTADGFSAVFHLPPGQARIAVTTATGVYTSLAQIPTH